MFVKSFKPALALITILFILLMMNDLPGFYRKVADAMATMYRQIDDYETIADWQTRRIDLQLELHKLDVALSQLATDLPSDSEPTVVIQTINKLIQTNGIGQNNKIDYGPQKSMGKYRIWPVQLMFACPYRNGIELLHGIETHSTLMQVDEITIIRSGRQTEFTVTLNLFLLNS